MANRLYQTLLSAVCILFLLLFFVLSYNNRLAADDFYYLGCYADRGIWGCMRDLYYGYSARWAAYLFTGWIVSLHSFKLYHFIFNSVSLLVLILVLNSIIRKVLYKKFKTQLTALQNFIYAILLTCSLFFSSYSIAETWFWLVQVCTYLWSIIMSLILLNVLLDEKFKWIHISAIIVICVFIGGASESFALVNIFLLSGYLVCSKLKFNKFEGLMFSENKTLHTKVIIALVFLLASFTITMLGPGNEARYSALPKVSLMQTIWIQVKSFIKILFIKTPAVMPYLILFSFPWFVLGKKFSDSPGEKTMMGILLECKNHFLLLLVLIFIFLIPTSFIMSELGPDRAMSQISFLVAFAFTALFFYAGNKINMPENIFLPLKTITIFFSVALVLFHLTKQCRITNLYAKAYDERIEYVSSAEVIKMEKKIVELASLPTHGMLYSAEISEDTSYFTNYFFRQGLKLNFAAKKKTVQQ